MNTAYSGNSDILDPSGKGRVQGRAIPHPTRRYGTNKSQGKRRCSGRNLGFVNATEVLTEPILSREERTSHVAVM